VRGSLVYALRNLLTSWSVAEHAGRMPIFDMYGSSSLGILHGARGSNHLAYITSAASTGRIYRISGAIYSQVGYLLYLSDSRTSTRSSLDISTTDSSGSPAYISSAISAWCLDP
jgi:hypothetical protein